MFTALLGIVGASGGRHVAVFLANFVLRRRRTRKSQVYIIKSKRHRIMVVGTIAWIFELLRRRESHVCVILINKYGPDTADYQTFLLFFHCGTAVQILAYIYLPDAGGNIS